MKIEDCINDTKGNFVSYDMQKIQELIKTKDKEFLKDLRLKLSISSRAQDCITAMMIDELLGHNPYDST